MTYKTAWRICNEIRKYMGWVDGDAPVGGSGPGSPTVEADKMFFGGKDKMGQDDKAIVLGAVERDGKAITKIINNKGWFTVSQGINALVKQGSHLVTDLAYSFMYLKNDGYRHESQGA